MYTLLASYISSTKIDSLEAARALQRSYPSSLCRANIWICQYVDLRQKTVCVHKLVVGFMCRLRRWWCDDDMMFESDYFIGLSAEPYGLCRAVVNRVKINRAQNYKFDGHYKWLENCVKALWFIWDHIEFAVLWCF